MTSATPLGAATNDPRCASRIVDVEVAFKNVNVRTANAASLAHVRKRYRQVAAPCVAPSWASSTSSKNQSLQPATSFTALVRDMPAVSLTASVREMSSLMCELVYLATLPTEQSLRGPSRSATVLRISQTGI